jgi:hypothetical protein
MITHGRILRDFHHSPSVLLLLDNLGIEFDSEFNIRIWPYSGFKSKWIMVAQYLVSTQRNNKSSHLTEASTPEKLPESIPNSLTSY